MKNDHSKPKPKVKPTEAPLDENPLAKPEKTRKGQKIHIEKLKTKRQDDWKV